MIDQEKVIKGLENIVSDMQEEIDEWRDYSDSELSHGLTCDCEWWYNTAQKLKDALALLKEQEPVVRCKDCICYDDEPGGTLKMCYCGLGWTRPDDYCSKGKRAKKMDGDT